MIDLAMDNTLGVKFCFLLQVLVTFRLAQVQILERGGLALVLPTLFHNNE